MSSKDMNWLKCYNGQMKSLQFKTLIRLLLSYLRLCVRTFLAICIYVFPVHETIIQNFAKKKKYRSANLYSEGLIQERVWVLQ